jgi:hypothetical protein
MPPEWLASAGGIVALAFIVVVRWVVSLQRRVNDHAERIAHLEGRRDV